MTRPFWLPLAGVSPPGWDNPLVGQLPSGLHRRRDVNAAYRTGLNATWTNASNKRGAAFATRARLH
jgi:hypothetical protein